MGESLTPPARIGLVGCGAISGQYLTTLARTAGLDLVAVADLDRTRADQVARAWPGVRGLPVDDLLTDPDVDIVLNLTTPAAHADVALRAIAAGKDVYGEKPLAATTAQGREVLSAAVSAGVRVGCAPDTVLGTGTQTARRAIDDGLIGTPVAATATMVTAGHERWHPDPDFYYQAGGGPLLDMGPYYVSCLVTLLGPVTAVVAAGSRTRDVRVIDSGPRRGERIPVAVDSHVTGVLTHAGGVLSTLVMSFDAVATRAAHVEVHGELGSLVVPDPNRFDGDVRVRGPHDPDWRPVAESAGYRGAGRGIGLADLAGTAPGQEPRAGGTFAYHVLDVLESMLTSVAAGRSVPVRSRAGRPAAVPLSDAR
ncbi:Gfo/Idh/MocA family oxidoreductase [Polymorphospora sp. NPDC051019]|uniref:Gfo/Idh/MocA family protein n=1 Tax=Polymorphospora sp. NPDC051019 TaxID=3155725 RepID=UPI00342C08FC